MDISLENSRIEKNTNGNCKTKSELNPGQNGFKRIVKIESR